MQTCSDHNHFASNWTGGGLASEARLCVCTAAAAAAAGLRWPRLGTCKFVRVPLLLDMLVALHEEDFNPWWPLELQWGNATAGNASAWQMLVSREIAAGQRQANSGGYR